MAESFDFEENQAEWNMNPNWTEILNNIYPDDEEEKEKKEKSDEKPIITENKKLVKLARYNYNDLSQVLNLENLLSFEQKISAKNEEIDYNSLKLIEFKNIKLNNLKEDILYYCTSPKNLINYKKIKFNEKNFEFYKDLEIENYMLCQKERSDIIREYKEIDNSQNQILKIENNKEFFYDICFPEKNMENKIIIEKIYLLTQKLNDYNFVDLKEMDNKKALSYLKEINDILNNIYISPYNLGLSHYNLIINNLFMIIEIISDKFNDKAEELIEYISILNDIFYYISSLQYKFFLLKKIKDNINILNDKDINLKNKFHLFFDDNINFNNLRLDENYKIAYLDFKKFLDNQVFEEEIDNLNNLDLNEHWTLNSGNNLYLFIKNPFKLKINRKQQFLIYFQINLETTKIINFGKIILIETENVETEKLIDVNITIKKDKIYVFFIINSIKNDSGKYFLICKIYNINMININNINNNNDKNNIIELSSFIPIRLINDSKYLYCLSNSDKIFILKINYSLNKSKYSQCKFNFDNYRMYNTFCFNNYIILKNINNNKKYSAIINKNIKEDIFIEINELKDENQIKDSKGNDCILNLSFNENKYVVTKLNINTLEFYFNIINNDENNKYLLFPFYDCYLDFTIDNYYEKNLNRICFDLNTFGNTDNKNKLNLIFLSTYHLNESNLKYIIQNIKEDKEFSKIKLYYIIILRNYIKYQTQSNEKHIEIKDIISILKEIIINGLKVKDKHIYYKIIKEIIIICSYLNKENIIELKDVKFIFDENIDIKLQCLLLELLLKQEYTKKDISLYKIILKLESDFLKNIFNTEKNNEKNLKLLKNYYLFGKTMKIAGDILLKISYCEKIFNNLLDIFLIISKNVNEISVLYKDYKDKMTNINKEFYYIKNFSFLYNSFIFRLFFLMLQKIIATKIYIKNNDIILSLYKTLLLLDKIDINDICYKFFDLENLIQIKSSLFLNTNIDGYQNENRTNYLEIITLNEPKNLIIKTSLTSHNDLNDYFELKIYKKENRDIPYIINLNFENENIFRNVSKIEIIMKNRDSLFLKDFVLNIIPLKNDFNENEYIIQKNMEDNKIILLIEKSIIQYLLFLFEEIYKQIDEFNNDKIILQHSKIYNSEIFKFIRTNKDKVSKEIDNSNPIINKINLLIKKIEGIVGKEINFTLLNQNLMNSLEEINKDMSVPNNYEKKIKNIDNFIKKEELPKNKKYEILDMNKYDKLFDLFKSDLQRKNKMLSQRQSNEILDILIKKLFFISIKYYNCLCKLDNLMMNINKSNDKYENLEYYNLFYSIYEESTKLKILYHEKKFEYENNGISEDILQKYEKILDFLYNIVFPSDDLSIEPNSSIVKIIINLIKTKNIEIEEIKKYSEIQNMRFQIQFIELMIINNLLNSLQNETNISFLLQLIGIKIRKSNFNFFFDKVFGVDYLLLEKFKHKFHLLLSHLSNKYLKNKYNLTTEILFIENLIWKIRGRNFPILNQILNVFEELKTFKIEKKDVFTFKHDCLYNFKYYNQYNKYYTLFEVFKIIAEQILEKEKIKNSSNSDLSLTRDISKISSSEYKDIFKIILSFFIDITPDNIFYHNFILFFYKVFINSKIILNYMKYQIYTGKKILNKIIKIIGDQEEIKDNDEEKKQSSQLIMTKLLYNILERDEDIFNLYDSLNENNEENSYLYLFKIIFKKSNECKENNIIKKYFKEILIICLNKLKEFKENEEVKKFIQNYLVNFNNLILLLSDEITWTTENKFYINKNIDKNLSELVLFNSNKDIYQTKGEIICFLDQNSHELFSNYISDFNKSFFNKEDCNFFFNNLDEKYKYALVIMEENSDLDFLNLSHIENIEIQNITIMKNKENYIQKKFIDNYKDIILNTLLNEIKNDKLNEKGIYFLFLIISKLIDIFPKENILQIFEYIWKFYIGNKAEEDDSEFISLEFIENIIVKLIISFIKINNYVENEINEEKNIIKEFIYIIDGYSFCLSLKKYNINITFKGCFCHPIKEKNRDEFITKIYDKEYILNYLNFYEYNLIYTDDIIQDNSILITESIRNNSTLSKLIKIIQNNQNKIKFIFTKFLNFNDNFNIELANFIKSTKIPVYIIENNLSNIIYEFFVEGKGDIFKFSKKKNNVKYYYNLLLDYEEKIKAENNFAKKEESNNNNQIQNDSQKIEEKKENEKNANDENDENFFGSIFNEPSNNIKIDDKKYDFEKKIIYDRLIKKPYRFFKMGAIKLAKRIIYDIICLNKYSLSEFKNIFGEFENLVNIFNYLCLEYYFNVNVNTTKIDYFYINNDLLKEKLRRYLLFVSNRKIYNYNDNNEWIITYFNYLKECLLLSQEGEKYNSKNFDSFLEKFDIKNKNKNSSFDKALFCDQNIEYDIFLFFAKNCLYDINFPIKMLLELIVTKIKYLLKIKFEMRAMTDINYYNSYNTVIKISDDCEITYIFQIINSLYDYYINNFDKNEIENFRKIFNESQLNNIMKDLIEHSINLDKFFYNEEEEELRYSKMRTQNISLIIEYTFKYFDLYLLLFLKQKDELNIFENWKNSINDHFNFYCNYKFLTIDKTSEINNIKEIYSLLAFIINNYSNNMDKDKIIQIKINDCAYNLKMNKINIYNIKDKDNNLDYIKLSIDNVESCEKNSFHNLIIIYYDRKKGIYSTIDLINFENLKRKELNVKIGKGKDEIILYPFGLLVPLIFFYDGNNNNINKEDIQIKLNKKIYSSFIKNIFNLTYFNEPFNLNDNGEVFYISKPKENNNKEKYKWLSYVINQNESIPKIKFKNKIKYLYAEFNNCFIIDSDSNLFGIGDNTYNQIIEDKNNTIKEWTQIFLPLDCWYFISCVCGKDYILCLIKDNQGKNKLYSKGNNDKFQCGITENKLIKVLTKCQFKDDIDIKNIFANEYFSSAITMDGKLYIWGTINLNTNIIKSIEIPTLVETNNEIIIKELAINSKCKCYKIIVLADSLNENGFYNKKCFSLEIENKFILKEIIPWNEKNSVPLKIYSHEEGFYILYLDENKYMNEINKNKNDLNYLYSFYNSENLDVFIKEINSISDIDISLFVDAIGQLNEESKKENSIENISLNDFIKFIKDKKNYKKLLKLFEINNNYLFNYLKYRTIINSKNYMKYYNTNILSAYKHLLQPLITKNTIFLISENRMKIFLDRLNTSRNNDMYRINIDRIKSNNFIEKYNESPEKIIDTEINTTIFGQVFQALEQKESKKFFIEKNNRLFRVNLLGENAIDEGGPYHEIISEICKDLQSDYLNLFIKTPNNRDNLGDLRDRYIINPDANKNIHKKAFEFFGKLLVLSISSGEVLNLNLHPIIFKLILNNEITFSDFETLDYNSYKLIQDLNNALIKNDTNYIIQMGLNFEIKNSNGSDIELKPDGKNLYVDISNVNQYINLYKLKRLEEFNIQIKEIQKGLFAGISIDVLQILSWRELEKIICGKNNFDVDDLKKHTNYDGYNQNEQVIKWFWEWLENISEEDKFKYLRFVSGRSRLPQANLGYNYKHVINKVNNKDLYPTSHTCFFTLHLPNYDNKNDLIKKLDYTIENSIEIYDS